jgi:hypothetical protein
MEALRPTTPKLVNGRVREGAYAKAGTRHQGNSEGTPPRASAGTRGHSSSSDSWFLRGFRGRRLPRLPSLPASLLNGKEGVDGSSPSEALQKPRNRGFFGRLELHELQYAVVWSRLGAFRFKRPLTTPRIRTRSRRLDEAAFERHAD